MQRSQPHPERVHRQQKAGSAAEAVVLSWCLEGCNCREKLPCLLCSQLYYSCCFSRCCAGCMLPAMHSAVSRHRAYKMPSVQMMLCLFEHAACSSTLPDCRPQLHQRQQGLCDTDAATHVLDHLVKLVKARRCCRVAGPHKDVHGTTQRAHWASFTADSKSLCAQQPAINSAEDGTVHL